MSGIFDSHTHYDDAAFDEDREELLSSLSSNGIQYVVNVGASIESCRKTVEMVEKHDYIYGALGIHPCEIANLTEEDYSWIREEAARNDKIVAIGEIGLDYYWEKENAANQKHHFERQIAMAKELNMPVIIHSREAAKDTYDIMKAMHAEECGGVVHCFSYHREEAAKYLDMGYYIGIGGSSTFKNNAKAGEVIAYTPMDRILLETDCPYLAPVPHRGKRNSSLNLPIVADLIAGIKNISREEVIRVTCENAKRMYGMEV
ncbi:MAG: TatD family hydrolase [Butyrivibrio sp.]|nr:TatD family hydrolase [Butyrivibrio sp.]